MSAPSWVPAFSSFAQVPPRTFTTVYFLSATPRMFTECCFNYWFTVFFYGVGCRYQHTRSLHASNPPAATKGSATTGWSLVMFTTSSPSSFYSHRRLRCSRVVINGTRTAIGFASFLSELGKIPLCFFMVRHRHCSWDRDGKICLVYYNETSRDSGYQQNAKKTS